MKKLVLTALLCGSLVQLGTGCIISFGSSDPGDGQFDVGWDLRSGPGNEAAAACPAGAVAEVVMESTDGLNKFVDNFDCADLQGLTGLVPPDDYEVSVNIVVGSVTFAVSNVRDVRLRGDDIVQLDFAFSVDHGFISLEWTVEGRPASETCIGDQIVRIQADLQGPQEPLDFIPDCDLGEFVNEDQIAVGVYDLDIDLLSDEVNQISLIPAPLIIQTELTVGNAAKLIDPIDFTLR